MSEATAAPPDLRAILVRIDRDLAESSKLREEANKFAVEQHKLTEEAAKLAAEAAKRQRDRGLAPWLAVVTILTGLGGLVGGAITVLHIFGKV
jgi:hypothetical protein